MGFTITKSAVVSGTGASLTVQVPPRVAGDYIQVIVISSQPITPRATGQNRVIDIPGVAAAFEWSVLNPGSTGTVAYDLGAAGAYSAWCQILHTDGSTANPPEPSVAFDLIVTALGLVDASVAAGGAARPTATVKNQGGTAIPSGTVVGVGFQVNGTSAVYSDSYSGGLAVGASQTLQANGGGTSGTFPRPSGAFTLTAVVDDVDRFPDEDSETNNTFSVTVPAAAPPVVNAGARSMIVPASNPLVAEWTDDVLASQSLTLHANYASESDVTNIIAPALRDSKVRFWRDGFGNNPASIRKVQSIASIAAGTRGCVTVDTRDGNNPGNVVAYLTALGGDSALWAAEGLNEWDIPRSPTLVDDAGESFPNPNYQNRMYAAIKAARDGGNSAVDGILIGTPTMADPQKTSQMGVVSAEVGMHHPYQGGAQPMDQMESKWIPNVDRMELASGIGSRPLFSSETGYHLVDSMAGQPGITMNAARKYVTRLFLGYRRLSRIKQRWIGASLYNLSTDQWSVLLTSTGARTAAFNALAAMNTLLEDRGTRPAPRALPGTIDTGGVADVQFHVMQKRDGSFWVALWREVKSVNQNMDASTRTDITVPRVPVAITLTSAMTGVVYRPATNGTPAMETTASGATSHNVQVGDEPTLLRLA